MLERVLQMDKDDQKFYNSPEYKRLDSEEKIDERINRIMDKLNVIYEDNYDKEGKFFDPYCDKNNPFYNKCMDLMNARCDEIIEYIEKGWADLQILDQFPDKIPTSYDEYNELSRAQIDRLCRYMNGRKGDSEAETYTPEYDELASDLWRRIIFCMVGWAIACVGFLIPSTLLSMLVIIAGVVVVEIPCFKILLAGGGIAALFASTFGADTIWVDRRTGKEVGRESHKAEGAVAGFLVWAIALVVGVFAVVFQIFKRFIQLSKMQKEENLELDLKHKPWAPIVSGIAFFILGIICVSVGASIMEARTSKIDDYTDEETTVMIEDIVDKMSSVDFIIEDEYDTNNHADPDYGTIYVKIEHDGETDSYLVTLSKKALKDFNLDESQYVRSEGAWYIYDAENKALGTKASADAVKELDKFTVEAMMAYESMLSSIGDVTIRDGYEKVLTFHNKNGATQEKLEVKFSDPSVGDNAIRILTNPYSFEAKDYGAYVDFIYKNVDFDEYLLPAA